MATFKILLVDDSPEIREALASLFRDHQDIQVTEATSAVEALTILPADDFDFVITDFEMPGMNGRAFMAAARSQGYSHPIAMCSGNPQAVEDALNAGLEAYGKSFSSLKALIARGLELQAGSQAPEL